MTSCATSWPIRPTSSNEAPRIPAGPGAGRGPGPGLGRRPRFPEAAAAHPGRAKGGNDGLNMVVPYADPKYRALRPRLGIDRDAVLKLGDAQGLHPALARLIPVWEARELAIVQ